MNVCTFIGRVASDPEYRETQGGVANCRFRVAVQRRFKDTSGERPVDFIQFIAWRSTADFIHKFIHKGDMVGIKGSLQMRSYQAQDGTNRTVSEIVVDEIKRCESRDKQNQEAPDTDAGHGFTLVDDDPDLPF